MEGKKKSELLSANTELPKAGVQAETRKRNFPTNCPTLTRSL